MCNSEKGGSSSAARGCLSHPCETQLAQVRVSSQTAAASASASAAAAAAAHLAGSSFLLLSFPGLPAAQLDVSHHMSPYSYAHMLFAHRANMLICSIYSYAQYAQ